jgi:hypothetical protein
MCFAFVPSNSLPPSLDSIRNKWAVERGLENVKSGILARIRTHENCSKGGRVSGRNNVISGHLERIRTPEHQSKASKSARAKESYETQANRARNIPKDKAMEGASKAGKLCVKNQKGIHSPEFKKARQKPVILTTPSGEEIKFDSIKKAAETYGLWANKLCGVCRGTRNHHKGYTARYAD